MANIADLLKSTVRKNSAKGSGGSVISSPGSDLDYPEQLKALTDAFYYGSPQQQQAYQGDGLYAELYNQSPAASLTGQVVNTTPEPGFLATSSGRDQALISDYRSQMDQIMSMLGDKYAGLDASDQNIYTDYKNAVGNVNLAPVSLASSNPEDIARQQQSYDLLMGAANGAMDASSNPADVARQQQVFGMLMGAAGGSLDASTNPEDLARQKQAADKLWGLTDTKMTAEEQFIMEKARMQEEQDRRGAMDAALNRLASQGMLGSGHEIGANLGAQQITSQNRMLQDLGALANASARSQSALGQFTSLATNMRNASDAMTSGNMDRRMGGMQGAGNLSTNMRNASDAMATSNMNRRASSAASAGGMATDMRAANDAIAQFNAGQSNAWNYQNADLQMGKATGIANTGFQVNQAAGNRAGSLAGIQSGTAGNTLNAGMTAGGNDDQRRMAAQNSALDTIKLQWSADQMEQAARAAAPGTGERLLSAFTFGLL